MIISMKSLQLFYLALAVGFASAVTNNDFIALKVKLKEYIAREPDRHIPLLVRASFHDLFLNDKATIQGCLENPDFQADIENVGLDSTMRDLQAIVRTNFPATGFTFGDVIAFAGKVAAESAYPCMKIPFKFNRSPCSKANPITNNRAPSPFIERIDQLSPMFNYMGGSITAQDMAILFAGAHGIKGARAGPTGWFGVFSTFSSGKEFIAKTFQESWKFIAGSQTLAEFFTGNVFNRQTSIIRLPTDMMFYPSKVPSGSNKDTSPEAAAIEAQLRGFTTQDRSVFDKEFERAYGKLLAIGEANQDFVDDTPIQVCPDINGPPPSSTVMPPSTSTSPILPVSPTVDIPGVDSRKHSSTRNPSKVPGEDSRKHSTKRNPSKDDSKKREKSRKGV